MITAWVSGRPESQPGGMVGFSPNAPMSSGARFAIHVCTESSHDRVRFDSRVAAKALALLKMRTRTDAATARRVLLDKPRMFPPLAASQPRMVVEGALDHRCTPRREILPRRRQNVRSRAQRGGRNRRAGCRSSRATNRLTCRTSSVRSVPWAAASRRYANAVMALVNCPRDRKS
jgi:hypothetical protein